jgi:hypothetical protein
VREQEAIGIIQERVIAIIPESLIAITPEPVIGMSRNTDRHGPESPSLRVASEKQNPKPKKGVFSKQQTSNNLHSSWARSSQNRALWPRLRRRDNSRASSSRAMSTASDSYVESLWQEILWT